jgi:SAM-dependent methyltransferase
MSSQFSTYARFYNLLYKDKDYAKEAAYIHNLINRHCSKSKKDLSLLDLACGTGKHLFELSDAGYTNLHGSDIAEAMITVAKENAVRLNKDIEFYNYSFQQSHQIPKKFDVVLSMFSAVNYIISFEDQLQTFRNIHGLLNEDGLFIFDYWNGNAVIRDYSPVKVLRKKDDQSEIIRISNTEIDMIRQSATVTFNCLYFEENRKINEFEEKHHLHYYHFSEMSNLLEMAGFTILHQSPFLEPEKQTASHDWNISIVARKRK